MTQFETEDLSDRQIKALQALLATPTVSGAARACGLSRATLERYLGEPAFREALSRAQADALRCAVASMTEAAGEAVAVLRGQLRDANPRIAQGAARALLQHLPAFVSLTEFEDRLEKLEREVFGEGIRRTS